MEVQTWQPSILSGQLTVWQFTRGIKHASRVTTFDPTFPVSVKVDVFF